MVELRAWVKRVRPIGTERQILQELESFLLTEYPKIDLKVYSQVRTSIQAVESRRYGRRAPDQYLRPNSALFDAGIARCDKLLRALPEGESERLIALRAGALDHLVTRGVI